MFLLFLGATWLIFAPSEEDKQKEEKNAGFNTELPDPRGAGIEEDKIAAYEQADIKRKQAEKCVHWETSQVLRMKLRSCRGIVIGCGYQGWQSTCK